MGLKEKCIMSQSENPNTNLIFQYLVINDDLDQKRGDVEGRSRSKLYREMADISRKSFEIYAKQIGADYLYSDQAVFTKEEYAKDTTVCLFECLRVVYDESFDKYDKVLFVDTDIVVNTTDNIFDECHGEVCGVLESDIRTENAGGYNSWDYNDKTYRDYREKYEWHDVPLVPALPPNHPSKLTIMNTGVVVWSREARLRARKVFDDWKWWFFEGPQKHMSIMNDQPYLSGQFMKHDFDVQTLDQKWNDTPTHYKDHWGEKALSANFLHYTGGGNKVVMVDGYRDGKFPLLPPDDYPEAGDICHFS
jgi:hypothetical protein